MTVEVELFAEVPLPSEGWGGAEDKVDLWVSMFGSHCL
jgi:hypothetical protein